MALRKMWPLFLASVCTFLLSLMMLKAQVHRFPDQGEKGVPGAVHNSFVIGWGGIEGAKAYQYVLSDNPLCFSGCSGDTREKFTEDTVAVEYNMQPDTWYYWITRIIYTKGDTSEWSLISSFFAENPEDSRAKLVSIAGNPVSGPELPLRFDWGLNPEASQVKLKLMDLNGNILRNVLVTRSTGVRFENREIPFEELAPGLYILDVVISGNLNNINNTFTLKVIRH